MKLSSRLEYLKNLITFSLSALVDYWIWISEILYTITSDMKGIVHIKT